jgi:hypothetical protein
MAVSLGSTERDYIMPERAREDRYSQGVLRRKVQVTHQGPYLWKRDSMSLSPWTAMTKSQQDRSTGWTMVWVPRTTFYD